MALFFVPVSARKYATTFLKDIFEDRPINLDHFNSISEIKIFKPYCQRSFHRRGNSFPRLFFFKILYRILKMENEDQRLRAIRRGVLL